MGSNCGEKFPRVHRVVKGIDFKRVFNGKPRRVIGNGLLLLIKGNALSYPRLGLAISKKHLKRAVDRNGVKRQIREQFRRRSSKIGGYDIVVMTRHGIGRHDNKRLRLVLELLWKKIE